MTQQQDNKQLLQQLKCLDQEADRRMTAEKDRKTAIAAQYLHVRFLHVYKVLPQTEASASVKKTVDKHGNVSVNGDQKKPSATDGNIVPLDVPSAVPKEDDESGKVCQCPDADHVNDAMTEEQQQIDEERKAEADGTIETLLEREWEAHTFMYQLKHEEFMDGLKEMMEAGNVPETANEATDANGDGKSDANGDANANGEVHTNDENNDIEADVWDASDEMSKAFAEQWHAVLCCSKRHKNLRLALR